jgi:glutathione synthase/RimK-type ligase-like ATP-grasp enzyme
MKEKKTTKLTCVVTGKTLFASNNYYQKKVEKAESEAVLRKTYICREAKQLLKKGHNINYVQEYLNVDNQFICKLTDSEIKEIIGRDNPSLKFRLNNSDNTTTSIIKTDPDVKKFIENILKDE